MREHWQMLITENPMLIEISRFRRKFLSFTSTSALNNAVLALAMVCYAGLMLLVVNSRGDIPPTALIYLQTVLMTLAGPAMLNGAIAGERERRSWDLLLAAPITKAQIVAGKFMGALAALGLIAALFAVPTLIAAVTYQDTSYLALFSVELISLTFAILVCSFTLFMSARVKRAFVALGATLATLLIGLVIMPILTYVVMASDRITQQFVLYMHPFIAFAAVEARSRGADEYIDQMAGMPQAFLYLFLSGVFLVWAERTLHFPENDVRFISKAQTDA